jgi:hypothetical protein
VHDARNREQAAERQRPSVAELHRVDCKRRGSDANFRHPTRDGSHTIVTTNGLFRACALVAGRVVATWRLTGPTLTVQLLEQVKASTVSALRDDGADVLRFLGLPDQSEVVVET